jgi:hypothetical protein
VGWTISFSMIAEDFWVYVSGMFRDHGNASARA